MYPLRGPCAHSERPGPPRTAGGLRVGKGQPQGTFFPANPDLALTPFPSRQPHLGSRKGTFLFPNHHSRLARGPGGFRRFLRGMWCRRPNSSPLTELGKDPLVRLSLTIPAWDIQLPWSQSSRQHPGLLNDSSSCLRPWGSGWAKRVERRGQQSYRSIG